MARKHTYSQVGNTMVCNQTGEIKCIKFGDEWFDLCGAVGYSSDFDGNNENDIYKAYGKPSEYKVGIWEDWCSWARKNNAHLQIAGHNCYFFTISGYITDEDGTRYNLSITYANNRCAVVTK